jgi:hypothetical protein
VNTAPLSVPERCDIGYIHSGAAGAGQSTITLERNNMTQSVSNTNLTHSGADASRGLLARILGRSATRTKSHWGADPWGRADARFWNGRRWTEHVVRDGRQAIDHPLMPSAAADL